MNATSRKTKNRHNLKMTIINFKAKQVIKFNNPPHGEQALVREFFNNRSTCYYVDVGANHPTIESQSWHLEQLGWKGLLIEPTPSYCDLLREKRKGAVVQYACSSPENQDKFLNLTILGAGSTLNPDLLIGKAAQGLENIAVKCKTLDSILEENKAPVGFDFMSIDIEGHEMEMFKGFSLTRWQPQLVLLEDHVINHEKHNHMSSSGYKLILRTGINSWYVPLVNGKYKFSISARLEIFRKYWLGLLPRKVRYHHW